MNPQQGVHVNTVAMRHYQSGGKLLLYCAQEVDKLVPDEKRKGKMRTVQETEYSHEPEMEGPHTSQSAAH